MFPDSDTAQVSSIYIYVHYNPPSPVLSELQSSSMVPSENVLKYHNGFPVVGGNVLRNGPSVCPITLLLLAGEAAPLSELSGPRLSRSNLCLILDGSPWYLVL